MAESSSLPTTPETSRKSIGKLKSSTDVTSAPSTRLLSSTDSSEDEKKRTRERLKGKERLEKERLSRNTKNFFSDDEDKEDRTPRISKRDKKNSPNKSTSSIVELIVKEGKNKYNEEKIIEQSNQTNDVATSQERPDTAKTITPDTKESHDKSAKSLSQSDKQDILKSRLSRLAKEKEEMKLELLKEKTSKERPNTAIARIKLWREKEREREVGPKDEELVSGRPKTSAPRSRVAPINIGSGERPKTAASSKAKQELKNNGTGTTTPRADWKPLGMSGAIRSKFEHFRLGKRKVAPEESRLSQDEQRPISSGSDPGGWKVQYRRRQDDVSSSVEEARNSDRRSTGESKIQRFVNYWPPDIDSISSGGNQSGVNNSCLFQTIPKR